MPRYHVTITGQGYDAMADLVRIHHVSVLHKTVRDQGKQRYTVDAIVDGTAIRRLTGKSFTAAQVQSIVNTLDLFIFPQSNPDGRNWSMTQEAMWRKNRRPGASGRHQHGLRRRGPESQLRHVVELPEVLRSQCADPELDGPMRSRRKHWPQRVFRA